MARSGGFASDIEAFSLDFIEGAETTVRSTTGILFGAIIKSTPVGDGRARGSWFATGQTPSNAIAVKGDLSKDGMTTANKAQRVVADLKSWETFFLTNNMPYINVLEFGGYPDPVKNGTRINESGDKADKSTWITPIYEKRSKSGYSKQAPNGMVRVNVARFRRLLAVQAKKNLPK